MTDKKAASSDRDRKRDHYSNKTSATFFRSAQKLLGDPLHGVRLGMGQKRAVKVVKAPKR